MGFLAFLLACQESGAGDPDENASQQTSTALFRTLPPEESGIELVNRLTESEELNYFTYIYAYNGAGVAIGDVDNDGLPDLFFSGNQVEDRLYRNLGGLRFEDVTTTALAGVRDGWSTGVVMVDLDQDGWLDIHVCRSGPFGDPARRRNLMLMNQRDGTFKDAAPELGIADTSNCTQATFLDIDLDGDLDLYLLVHPFDRVRGQSNFSVLEAIRERRAPTDRLYRNDGGSFTDITYDADVQNYAYGLGVMAADLDLDGRQDLYVSNDFDVPDLMYMAREDGTFSEELQFRTRHISYYSMGCDVADYDNDGLPDIVVLDMTADDHVRSKTNMGSMAPEKFWSLVRGGYYFQYMVNTLQHNNGNGTFSDLGQLAGIARTDWSWAPLLADLDNDGWKDLVVTNGYKYDIRDNDYQQGVYDSLTSGASFFRTLDLIPATRLRNRLFRNNGDLTFSDSTLKWGFTEAMNSNGAAYGDLDGDGDLDLVTNNLDQVATVHENRAEQLGNHHLRVTLVPLPGRSSWGAKVRIRTGDERQYVELSPVRGYQSCVEPVVHFGVGTHQLIDELVVEWPGPEGGSHQVLSGLPVDRTLVLQQGDATPGAAPAPETSGRPLFTELTGGSWPEHVHEEDPYDDFRLEVLLPHKMSELGPLLSVGDMNGDGTDDLFTSGAHGQACRLWLRSTQGGLRASASQPWEAHADQEHLGSCSFDADGDGDLDLLLLAGSNQHDIRDPLFTQRLFLNDGRGGFTEDAEALPPMVTSAMRADAADIDGDGDMDLFIGGRQTPAHYPFAPRSFLLVNDGKGRFSDATEVQAPQAMGPGMVTAVRFADIDADGDPDLLLTGEWMHPMVFVNDDGRFTDRSAALGLDRYSGWWSSLAVADVDADGDPDLIGGNLGWNSKFQADAKHPVHVYWADFDDNGRSDIVLAKEKKGTLLPVRGRECSSEQCPMILGKFPTYQDFAHADLPMIYSEEKLAKALHLTATHMWSSVFLNEGADGFREMRLPMIAQSAPINAVVPYDVDGDGHLDLLVAGNNWSAEVETVRYDAGTGLVLKGDGTGRFEALPVDRSGFFANRNVKDLALLNGGNTPVLVVANNHQPLQYFRLERPISGFSAK